MRKSNKNKFIDTYSYNVNAYLEHFIQYFESWFKTDSLQDCTNVNSWTNMVVLASSRKWNGSFGKAVKDSMYLIDAERYIERKNEGLIKNKVKEDIINVFVPTTPNPTSGFLLMVPKKDLIFLDVSFEQASKFIVSAGTTNID